MSSPLPPPPLPAPLPALHERPAFAVGDRVRISTRAPIGHYRVPIYVRGREARITQIIEPALIDNEEEGYGRNAGGLRGRYYRVDIPLSRLWNGYPAAPGDALRIEIFETWLERA